MPSQGISGVVVKSPSNSYRLGELLGHGSFGVVWEARCLETGERVAIKSVHQDPRYKNRELEILAQLQHPNIVHLKDHFYTTDCTAGGETKKYLNAVMDYIPQTLYRVLRSYTKLNQHMPILHVKLYLYQMCRSLGYLHELGICHRDIKPQNLLVDVNTFQVKLCDFGSAKKLVLGETSVAYICSRFYRAPELMLGATTYAAAVDVWSLGCVFGELLLGGPLFAGETSLDQLVKIIHILGTPTANALAAMGSTCGNLPLPNVPGKELRSIFGAHVREDAVDLLSQFLRYEPDQRVTPLQALSHPYFDELKDEFGKKFILPNLFVFTDIECRTLGDQTQPAVAQKHNKKDSKT